MAADVNLLDLDRWARDGIPHEWFAEKRQSAPVWRQPGPDGEPGFWVVSGHKEVVELGRCPHAMSSDEDNGGVTGLGVGDELGEQLLASYETAAVGSTDDGLSQIKQLLTMDPPEHTANRKLVNRSFTTRTIAELEPSVRELAAALLDAHRDGEPFDFTTEVAMPLPMQVIGDLLGAPRDNHLDLLQWSNEVVATTDPEYLAVPGDDTQLIAGVLLARLFIELQESYQSGGRPDTSDLVAVLSAAEIDGEPLTPVRYALYMILLATAGNETTRNAMSHGVWAFAQFPEQWNRLRADRSLLPSAVDEVLRWSSPLLYFRRNAITNMTVAGADIAAGDVVSLWYSSANFDEAVFDEPLQFDFGRSPNPQVSFGGGGAHYCLGASLARQEIRVLLEEMLDRYERIEIAGPVQRLRSNLLNGVKHLPVRLT
jgi:cholest-4-en-3-one 26-monooxygenase